MALSISSKRSFSASKLTGAFVGIFALIIQSIIPLNIPAAFAADALTVTPSSHSIDGAASPVEVVSTVDATGYESLQLVFDYNIGNLEASDNDTFTYGWRIAGTIDTNDLGTIEGETGNPGPNEDGNVSTPLPAAAANNNLELYFINDSSAINDTIAISNIAVSGDSIVGGQFNGSGAAYRQAPNYDGIAVDVRVKDVFDLTGLSVVVNRTSGGAVEKTAKQSVIDSINAANGAPISRTAPIVVQPGTYDETGSSSWNAPVGAIWDETTVPIDVVLTMTFSDSSTETETLTINDSSVAYADIAPEAPPAPPVVTEVDVFGDTASGENQPGWLFNRDLSTQTPFEFNSDEAVIGSGSLYVQPITNTINGSSDKFIGEFFALTKIDDITSFSYDYKIGAGGDASDANEFYLNVYANYGESSGTKYYDCRYNVVPTIGSTSDFTMVTFDPTESYPVATRGGASASPYTCPSVPADMNTQSPGSTVRAFAINVGDTAATDQGLDGYYDNVVFATTSAVTTYDFEPDTTAPSQPQMLGFYKGHNSDAANFVACSGLTNTAQMRIDWADNNESDLAGYWFGTKFNSKHKWVPASKSHYDGNITPGNNPYYYTVIAVDTAGNESQISEQCGLTLDQEVPAKPTGLKRVHSESGDIVPCGAVEKIRSLDPAWDAYGGTDFDHYNYETRKGFTDTFTTNYFETNGWMPTADGSNGFRIQTVDKAGNKSAWSAWCDITFDNTAPEIDSLKIMQDGSDITGGTTNDRFITIKWSSDDTDVDFFEYKNALGWSNKGSQTSLSGNIGGANPNADGNYTYCARATDHAGNTGAEVCVDVTLDETAPTVLLDDIGPTVSGTVEITGVANDNLDLSHYNLSLYPSSTDLSDGETHSGDRRNTTVGWGSGTVNGLGVSATISRMLDTTLLADGDYQLRLAARDEATNRDTSGVTGDPFSVHVIAFTVENAVVTTVTPPATPFTTNNEGNGGEELPEQLPATFGLPAGIPGFFGQTPAPNNQPEEQESANSGESETDVLGEQDNEESGTPLEDTSEVLGLMDQKLFGFAWYWWLVALAAIVGAWLLIAAAIRRRREQE